MSSFVHHSDSDDDRGEYESSRIATNGEDLTEFEEGFDERLFMANLTNKMLTESKKPQAFVPADFSVSLKKAMDKLQDHLAETDRRIDSAKLKAQRAEETHKACMKNHTARLEMLLAQFHRLDSKISKVTHTAIRIGNTLETVDSQKKNNEEGKKIIRHFLSFNTGLEESLDPVFRTLDSLPALQEAARLIQTLQAVATNLRVKGAHVAQELITRKAREIEDALLKQFANAQKSSKLDEMKMCASSLLHFPSNSVVEWYVSNACESLDSHLEILSRAGILNSRSYLPLLAQFHSDIYTLIEKEVGLIAKVFPDSFTVICALLLALSKKMSAYADIALIDGCQGQASEVSLAILDLSFSSTTKLANQLAVGPLKSFGMDVTEVAEVNFTGVYKKHLVNYLERERALLTESVTKEIVSVVNENEEEKLFTKMKKSQEELFARFKERIRAMLNITIVDTCILYASVALARCQNLSPAEDLPDQAFLLFNGVLSLLVDSYLRPVLGVAAEHAMDEDKNGQPNHFHFEVVQLVTLCQDKLRQFYVSNVVPLVSKNSNTDAICDNTVHELFGLVESLLLGGLERTLDAAIRHCNKLLLPQKTTSYKPKDDKALEDNDEGSAAFGAVADYVERVYNDSLQALEGQNLDKFLTVFAFQLLHAIRTHLNKFQISTLGAALLKQDLKLIQDGTRKFRLPAVDQLFDNLLSKTQMFYVAPEHLPALLLTPEFKKINMDELAALVKLRADFHANKPKMLMLFPMLAS